MALRRGSFHELGDDRDAVWTFARLYEEGEAPIPDASQSLVCVINLSGSALETRLDLSEVVGDGTTPLQAANIAPGAPGALPDITAANRGSYPVTVPAYGAVILEAALTRPPPEPVTIDGALDDAYTEIGANGGVTLWAAFGGDTLYLATTPARDERDRFIVVSSDPGELVPAMWAKSGNVAAYDAYIGNESVNGWSGWFDAADPGGPVVGSILEGSLNLTAQYGEVPGSIRVASLAYLTGDGEPLDPTLQIPRGNGDPDVQAGEFIELDLDTLGQACPGDLDGSGSIDFTDLNLFVGAFQLGDPAGDLDGDGSVGFEDLNLFVSAFADGCP